jgi:hypothetical protein
MSSSPPRPLHTLPTHTHTPTPRPPRDYPPPSPQAFNCWRDVRLKFPAQERDFLRRSFLSFNTLSMMAEMRRQFFDHLVAIGFVREPAGAGGRGRARGGRGSGGKPLDLVFAMEHCNGAARAVSPFVSCPLVGLTPLVCASPRVPPPPPPAAR